MSILGMTVSDEVKVKCQECGEISFALSEYANCDCGGYAMSLSAFESYDLQPV